MLKLHHKFIQMNMVLIYFFFLFCYHPHVYAKEKIVNADNVQLFTNNVVGGKSSQWNRLIVLQANLTSKLGLTTLEDLRKHYKSFSLNQCSINSRLIRVFDNIVLYPLFENIVIDTDTAQLNTYNTSPKIFQHVFTEGHNSNELEVLVMTNFTEIRNELTLNFTLMTNGCTVNGKKFKVTADTNGKFIFHSF